MTRVALIAREEASFIRTDRALLADRFSLRFVRWRGKRSIPRLAWAIARSDVAFSWFAEDHAYGACRLARLLRKKSIVFVGGGDAAKRPDLGYGIYLDPTRAERSRYAVMHSDLVLVVDEYLRKELRQNGKIDRPDILTVPLGIDTVRYRSGDGARTTVLTVGMVDEVNVRRKGLDVFVEVARRMPDLPFVLIGGRQNAATERLRLLAPTNLMIVGRVSDDDLLRHFQRARVYAQLSRYEAFGSALAEAMAAGCVPVGTRVGGIPTVLGDTGPYAAEGNPESAAAAIRRAYEEGDGRAARARIVREFSREKRANALIACIEGLVDANGR